MKGKLTAGKREIAIKTDRKPMGRKTLEGGGGRRERERKDERGGGNGGKKWKRERERE